MQISFFAPDDPTNQIFKGRNKLFEISTKDWIGKSGNFLSWIVRGYLFLKKAGLDCEIVNKIPEEGILIADADTIHYSEIKNNYFGKLMLICIKADRDFRPSAHLHVVQNINDEKNNHNRLWNPYFIKFWPQPALIPRARERGTKVENISAMVVPENCSSELLSDYCINSINSIGCKLNINFDKSKWNDYSEVDLVTAIRSFDGKPYYNKPASKLVNSWLAGVPALLPPESAYMSFRESELDFLLIRSVDELIAGIKKLKNQPKLYLAMRENGMKRAKQFTEEVVIQEWLKFFNEYVPLKYEEWLKMSELQRKYLYIRRHIKLKQIRLQQKLNS